MFNQRSTSSLPWLYRYRSSPTFIIATVCVAIFCDVFLFGTIIPILPYALPHRIHVDYDDVQIYISILLAVYGGALLAGAGFFGWIGDKLARRHAIFLLGNCTLLAATLLLAFGRNIGVLVAGRMFQGVSAAVAWTSGLALLTDLLGPERYGEAMGYASMGASVGTTSAPLLGGIVYAYWGYHAVSYMGLTAVGIAIILAALLIEPRSETASITQDEQGKRQSNGGSADVSTERPAAVPSNVHGKTNESGTSHTESRLIVAAQDALLESADEYTSLIPRTQHQKRLSSGPAYLVLLRSPRILAAMGGLFTYSFVILSMEGMIPMFVKDMFHWGSAQAALTFLSWIIPSFLSPIAGKMSDRFGSRWMAVSGLLFAVPPLILMRLVTHDSAEQKVLLCCLLSLVGLGFMMVPTSCVSDLTIAANELTRDPSDDASKSGASMQSFGLFVVSYSAGGLFGPPITGAMKSKVSWGTATLILAGVCLVTSVPIAFKTSGVPRRPKSASKATAAPTDGATEA